MGWIDEGPVLAGGPGGRGAPSAIAPLELGDVFELSVQPLSVGRGHRWPGQLLLCSCQLLLCLEERSGLCLSPWFGLGGGGSACLGDFVGSWE